MEKKLKNYRLDLQTIERMEYLAKWLQEENGIKFTQTDVITYLTNWYYNNIVLPVEKEGEENDRV